MSFRFTYFQANLYFFLIIKYSDFFWCFLIFLFFFVCLFVFHVLFYIFYLDTLVVIAVNLNFFLIQVRTIVLCISGPYQLISMLNLSNSAITLLYHNLNLITPYVHYLIFLLSRQKYRFLLACRFILFYFFEFYLYIQHFLELTVSLGCKLRTFSSNTNF